MIADVGSKLATREKGGRARESPWERERVGGEGRSLKRKG